MEQLSFKLDKFEGPLDLLLILIKKNKVSIYDIPIAEILDQYMEVMQQMEGLDLELSSEFLVMAATLLQIKSKMLLPSDGPEEEEDPRAELVRRLVEYSRVKETLEFLREHENKGNEMFFKLPDVIERPPAVFDYSVLTIERLFEAYQDSFSKLERKLPPPKRSFSGIVGHEKVSVKERVLKIWRGLIDRSRILFKDIFKGAKSRAEAVASFLAVLELIKLNKIKIEGGTGTKDDYMVKRVSDDDNFNFEEIEE